MAPNQDSNPVVHQSVAEAAGSLREEPVDFAAEIPPGSVWSRDVEEEDLVSHFGLATIATWSSLGLERAQAHSTLLLSAHHALAVPGLPHALHAPVAPRLQVALAIL